MYESHPLVSICSSTLMDCLNGIASGTPKLSIALLQLVIHLCSPTSISITKDMNTYRDMDHWIAQRISTDAGWSWPLWVCIPAFPSLQFHTTIGIPCLLRPHTLWVWGMLWRSMALHIIQNNIRNNSTWQEHTYQPRDWVLFQEVCRTTSHGTLHGFPGAA